jgi:hypothetical protein
MDQTLIGVVIGGLIGIVGSVLGFIGNIYISKSQMKQNLTRLGFELGTKEYEMQIDLLKWMKAEGLKVEGSIDPPWSFVWYNHRILKELSNGTLTPDLLTKITNERKKLQKEIRALGEN